MTGDDTLRGQLRLCGIGGFALMRDGAPIRLRNRKAQALIALLALSAPARLSREKIADLLWSGSALDQARQSLRQSLHDIRRALGGEAAALIEAGRAELALAEDAPRLDALALLDEIAGADVPPTVDWTGLSLFPGLEEVDPEFGDWLDQRRRAFGERLTGSLEARMAASQSEARSGWARALVALDPAHEPACRALMAHDAARGDLRAALKRYAGLWERLEDELAVEPSPETQALAVKLKSTETLDAAPTALPTGLEPPNLVIAVPPFRLEGVPEARGYLARGFRQDLIASLTPYREWVVIEPAADEELSRRDGVYGLDGVAFPRQEGVRINATLKEMESRRFVWGEQDIELSMESWFDTCRLTTRRIAAVLDLRVSGDRLSRRAGVSDISLPLYDKLLKARDLMTKWAPEADQRAEAILRGILEQEPDFARARMGLAQIVNARHIVFPGQRRERDMAMQSLRDAEAAADADPLDADALLTLGWSFAMMGQHEKAQEALRAASRNNPTHPKTLASAADALAQCGAMDEALELEAAVQQLERGFSRMSNAHLVTVRLLSGRYAEAAESGQLSGWNIPLGGGWQCCALALAGDVEEAGRVWDQWAAWLRARWSAPRAPSDADILDWFLAAPPLRDAAARAMIEKGLHAAMRRTVRLL